MKTPAVDTEAPADDERTPAEPAPPADESVQDRHTRELSQSLDALEDTLETGLAHALRRVVPVVLGVFVTLAGLYALGRRLRHRAEPTLTAEAD